MTDYKEYVVHRKKELNKLYYVVLYMYGETTTRKIYDFIRNNRLVGSKNDLSNSRTIGHSLKFHPNAKRIGDGVWGLNDKSFPLSDFEKIILKRIESKDLSHPI